MLNDYKKTNNIFGWVAFAISLVVMMLTVAPTASFWDCGEFISCSNEFEVPHPPGPPIYLILGRLFSMLAFNNVEMIAYMVNLLSVLSAAFTVLFLFWTITFLAKKMIAPEEKNPSNEHTLLIMFAGLVGALACNFSDSFWFNAVEAEVYAMSSVCTALVFWLMLKWEARADDPYNLQWIVLIAFVMGLSIGVHLLNLLAVPALAFIYYFKKYEFSWSGVIATTAVSIVILAFIQYGIIQKTVEYLWVVEKFMVGYQDVSGKMSSGLGMPTWSGVAVAILLMIGAFIAAIWGTHNNKTIVVSGALGAIGFMLGGWLGLGIVVGALALEYFMFKGVMESVIKNTVLLSLIYIMAGYSTYTIIVIRANTEAPINENDPSDVTSLLSYMRREQYGDRPLFKGPLYNYSQQAKIGQGRANFTMYKNPRWFVMEDGKYTTKDGKSFKVRNGKAKVEGLKAGKESLLEDGTRFKLDRTGKVQSYRVPNRYIKDGYKNEYQYDNKYKKLFPRMYSSSHYAANKHLFGYQKFVKNQGADKKSPYDDRPTDAEDMKFFINYQIVHMYLRYFAWNFIGRESDRQDDGWEDGLFKGYKGSMPAEFAEHPGKNNYFFFPLLLGLFGLVWHGFGRPKDAATIMVLFLFTGLAIIVYLNQPPSQPRERDYSYVGSFQTFCIWIGLGVIGLYDLLRKTLKGSTHIVVGVASLFLVPGIMAYQNWDDHDRHLRYIAPDSAHNLLNSCAPNALLFTNGDNDTFPLWYLQEVEGVRTDVRVVNLSLLNTDWYVRQMTISSNESAPLPISLAESEYTGDKNAYKSFKPRTVQIPIDVDALIASGTVKETDRGRIINPMPWKVRTRGGAGNPYLLKQDYMIKDILETNAKNGWKRPIYFSSTIPPSSYVGLTDYFQMEGLAYRVAPLKKGNNGPDDKYSYGTIDKDVSYNLLMNKFKYREMNNPKLYIDEHIRKTIVGNIRSTIFRTANAYIFDAQEAERENKAIGAQLATLSGPAADSLSRRQAANLSRAATGKKRAAELLALHDERIPATVIEIDPVFHLFLADAHNRLGNREKREEIFAQVRDRVIPALAYKKDKDYAFKEMKRYENSIHLMADYYRRYKEIDPAIATIDELLAVSSGKAQTDFQNYKNLLLNEKQKAAKPAVAPAPPKPAN